MKKEQKELLKELSKIEQQEALDLRTPSTHLSEELDLAVVNKMIRNIQSIKSKLKKQKELANYDYQMDKVLRKEQILKELKGYFTPQVVPTTAYTQEIVDELTQDEVLKALKSIQSKKCNTRYLIDKEPFENACKVEEMLVKRRELLKGENVISKKSLDDVIGTIESLDDMSKEQLVAMLKGLKK